MNQRWELLAGGGVCVDFLLSDVFTTGYQQIGLIYHEYQVEENRQRRWTVPLRAEIGALYRPADAKKQGSMPGASGGENGRPIDGARRSGSGTSKKPMFGSSCPRPDLRWNSASSSRNRAFYSFQSVTYSNGLRWLFGHAPSSGYPM